MERRSWNRERRRQDRQSNGMSLLQNRGSSRKEGKSDGFPMTEARKFDFFGWFLSWFIIFSNFQHAIFVLICSA